MGLHEDEGRVLDGLQLAAASSTNRRRGGARRREGLGGRRGRYYTEQLHCFACVGVRSMAQRATSDVCCDSVICVCARIVQRYRCYCDAVCLCILCIVHPARCNASGGTTLQMQCWSSCVCGRALQPSNTALLMSDARCSDAASGRVSWLFRSRARVQIS